MPLSIIQILYNIWAWLRGKMSEPQQRPISPSYHLPPARLPSPVRSHQHPGQVGGTRIIQSPPPVTNGPSVHQFNPVSEERKNLLSRYWRYREWSRHVQLNVPVVLPEEEEGINFKQNFQPNQPKYSDEPPGFRWVEIEIV